MLHKRLLLRNNLNCFRIRKEDAYGRPLAGRLHGMEREELIRHMVARGRPGRPLSRNHSASGDPSAEAKSRSSSIDVTRVPRP